MNMRWVKRGQGAKLLLAISILSQWAYPAFAADIYTWTTSSVPSSITYRVAMSSDASVILSAKSGGGVYLSTNSGTSFAPQSFGNYQHAVAVSADGNKLFAARVDASVVWVSTDRGQNWTQVTGQTRASGNNNACMSADGSVWAVSSNGGSMYVSTNNGSTWTADANLGTGNWWACGLSNDGSTRVVTNLTAGTVKYSTNSGATWATSSTSMNWPYCVGLSSDGTKVIVADRDVKIMYRSTNSGASFVNNYTFPSSIFTCASSSDGTKLVAGLYPGAIYVSTNSGTSWNAESSPPTNEQWYSAAITADGSKIFAAAFNAISSYFGKLVGPATVTINSGGNSSILYRALNSFVATANTAGKVTFFANGKKIPGCISLGTNVSLSVTCNYRPSLHGPVTISARIAPTSPDFTTNTVELLRTNIILRSNNRG